MWNRAPLRLRLTLVFGAAMAAVLVGLGLFTHLRLEADLLASVDFGLRPRAEAMAEAVRRAPAQGLGVPQGNLIDPDEAFAQVLSATGSILDASSAVTGLSLLSAAEMRGVSGPTFGTRRLQGFDDPVRLLAVPIARQDGKVFLVVGSTLGDMNDALQRLLVVMATAGPVALLLTVGAGWLLAGAALRPVEQIRREAAAISASEPARRLPVPATGDELARLAVTLNSMLDRLQVAMDREHRFVDDASHELRTPLATLRAEIDLALARQRTIPELEASLGSAREDVERLQRLADDLLVLARSRGGRVPIRRAATPLAELLTRGVRSVEDQAGAAGVVIAVEASTDRIEVDPDRFQQALRNLLENAIRFSPRGGEVRLTGVRTDRSVLVLVEDSGPGFPPELLEDAFQPFARGTAGPTGNGGTGLGLAIVRAIAEAHGGTARAENSPDGARAIMEFPA